MKSRTGGCAGALERKFKVGGDGCRFEGSPDAARKFVGAIPGAPRKSGRSDSDCAPMIDDSKGMGGAQLLFDEMSDTEAEMRVEKSLKKLGMGAVPWERQGWPACKIKVGLLCLKGRRSEEGHMQRVGVHIRVFLN